MNYRILRKIITFTILAGLIISGCAKKHPDQEKNEELDAKLSNLVNQDLEDIKQTERNILLYFDSCGINDSY